MFLLWQTHSEVNFAMGLPKAFGTSLVQILATVIRGSSHHILLESVEYFKVCQKAS